METTELEQIIPQKYYEAYDNTTGSLPYQKARERITEGIRQIHPAHPATIQRIIDEGFHESLEHPHLQPGVVELFSDILMAGGKVVIWTVGDEGPYVNPETGVTHLPTNFQRAKIEKSRMIELIAQELEKRGANQALIDNNLTIHIKPANKHEALKEIFDQYQYPQRNEFYVVDDKKENIEKARQVAQEYPLLHFHDYWVNNDHPNGNFNAFNRYFREKVMNRGKTPQTILVIDWDQTAYNEAGRMKKAIDLIKEKLHALENPQPIAA